MTELTSNIPPIYELSMAARFPQPIDWLDNPDLRLFASRLREEFPHAEEETLPLTQMPEAAGLSQDLLDALPSVAPSLLVLLSHDQSIQLQAHNVSFTMNWKRRSEPFPGFDVLQGEFNRFFEQFDEFVDSFGKPYDLAPVGAYLKCLALVLPNSVWQGTADTPKAVPSLQNLDLGVELANVNKVQHTVKATTADGMNLDIMVDDNVILVEEQTTALMFDITAESGSALSDRESNGSRDRTPDQWFSDAYRAVLRICNSLTTPAIQAQWQPGSQ